jgi:hypothetical protein
MGRPPPNWSYRVGGEEFTTAWRSARGPIEKDHPPDDLCASRFAHPAAKNCRLNCAAREKTFVTDRSVTRENFCHGLAAMKEAKAAQEGG